MKISQGWRVVAVFCGLMVPGWEAAFGQKDVGAKEEGNAGALAARHLFILSGQSNMAGMDPAAGFLPELERLLGGAEVHHLKIARGGQPIRLWIAEWNEIAARFGIEGVKNEAAPYYDQILARYRELSEGKTWHSVTFLWMQGERDAKSGLEAAYEASLKQLIANLRRDLERPDLNVVIGRISDHEPAPDWREGWNAIREIHVRVAREDPHGAWVDTDDLNDKVRKDASYNDLHYTKEGYALFGKRLARQAVRLIGGRVPDPAGRPGEEVVFQEVVFHLGKAAQIYASVVGEDAIHDWAEARETFLAFLPKRWVAGRTTRQEVEAWLGQAGIDLDRPEQDGLVMEEYLLAGFPPNAAYLMVEYHPDTEVLAKFGLGYMICGFCPHIYARDAVGRWRLEGKMLANRVGRAAAGADLLVLPRLEPAEGRLEVKVSNLAPEREFLEGAELGTVPLRPGEEIVATPGGGIVAFRPDREWSPAAGPISMAPELKSPAIVLEVRNSAGLETALRKHYLEGAPYPVRVGLTVLLDHGRDAGETRELDPVGTKFLRRLVLSDLPAGVREVRVLPSPYWEVRRAWTGEGRAVEVTWVVPERPEPFELEMGEERLLRFHPGPADQSVGHVLRLGGYYEFR